MSDPVVARVSAAMQVGGVDGPPVDVGGRWFSVERRPDGSGERVFIVDDGSRRPLLDPVRPNFRSGNPGRGGWVAGPRGPDGEQYAAVADMGESESDANTAGLIIDVRNGRQLHTFGRDVMGVGFLSPTEFVYEQRVIHRGHPTLPDDAQRIYLRRHDITTGRDEPFTIDGVDYDDNTAHGFVRSDSGRWLVVTEAADFFGLGNRTYLLDLEAKRTYVHGADRSAIVHHAFTAENDLLLEVDGEIQRVRLGDPSPEAVRGALAAPEVLMPAEDGVRIQEIQPFTVDGRQVLAVSRRLQGAYLDIVLLDPAAEGPQVVDLMAQMHAWPVLAGDTDRVLGPEGSILGMGLGKDGRPVFSFEGHLIPSEVYRLDYEGPSTAARVTRLTANREVFDERVNVPRLHARLYEATAEDGVAIPWHYVAPTDAPRELPALGLHVYGFFNFALTPGFNGTTERFGAEVLLGGGGVAYTAFRGSGELGGPHFRAGQGENNEIRVSDIQAVGRDMVRRGLVEPERLTTFGASGAGPVLFALARRDPKLFRNIFAVNPAVGLDADRNPAKSRQHNRTIAYGNPDDPVQRRRLSEIDPLTQLRRRLAQGGTFFLGLVQGTKDDRVLPEGVAELRDEAQAALDAGAVTGEVTLTHVNTGHHIVDAGQGAVADSAFVSFLVRATGWDPRPALRKALAAKAPKPRTAEAHTTAAARVAARGTGRNPGLPRGAAARSGPHAASQDRANSSDPAAPTNRMLPDTPRPRGSRGRGSQAGLGERGPGGGLGLG